MNKLPTNHLNFNDLIDRSAFTESNDNENINIYDTEQQIKSTESINKQPNTKALKCNNSTNSGSEQSYDLTKLRVNPVTKKFNNWTLEEDEKLTQLVHQFQKKNWKKIASIIKVSYLILLFFMYDRPKLILNAFTDGKRFLIHNL